ncbi:MAG: alpha-L-fucosidase [Tannerellaceae bacterium]|jgi:alpha-L-fucosidase|nr:alpha-L-fucosidase [Tannerellaceae bacterium]
MVKINRITTIVIATITLFPFTPSIAQKKKAAPSVEILQIPSDKNQYYGPYSPTLSSIRRHECPEWFLDAKFGMFIDWGLYSVAGWAPKKEKGAMYPDWYMKNMLRDKDVKAYHEKTYGKDFQPDDFIPLFTAEDYRPDWLIDLANEAGMKYVIPFCKHHDGFCLWPSSHTMRDAMDMGPKRDLIRPLVEACNRKGLKFGFYFSLDEWYYPVIDKDGNKLIREWANKGYYPWESSKEKIHLTGKRPVKDFFADYIVPQANEFIDMYDPDILWFDGDWDMSADEYHSPDIISHFYNHAAGRKEVAINDRNGRTRFQIGDFFCSEYHALPEGYEIRHPWEENRGISQSFGYNREDTENNVLSPRDFIHMFIRTVSENGNLLLIVNLDGKGALPEMQERRLREIGQWLKINGEAIYATRPWLTSVQKMKGETVKINEGIFGGIVPTSDSSNQESAPASTGEVRFTQSKDGKTVYAICTEFPKTNLEINSIHLSENGKVTMLGSDGEELKWTHKPTHERLTLSIDIPSSLYDKRKSEHAWVFKITL